MYHEVFEKQVMEYLLVGNSDDSEKLKQQYISASVISREFTGVGFFTNYFVNNEELCLPRKKFTIGNVLGYIDNEVKMGFILFISNGYISMLEGYTFDTNWSDFYENIELRYVKYNTKMSSIID